MDNTNLRRACRGFTLVELLVVIGIIALLISILLPTLSRARQAGNSVACQSNLRQVGLGLVIYADANDQSLPTADRLNSAGTGTWHPFWFDHVAAAIGVKEDGDAFSNHDRSTYADAFTCPSATIEGGWIHYSVHPRLIPSQFPPGGSGYPEASHAPRRLVGPAGSQKLTMQPYKLSQIPRSTEMLLASDASQLIPSASTPWASNQWGNAANTMTRLNTSSIFWNQFTAIGPGFSLPSGFSIDGVTPTPTTPIKFQSGQLNRDSTSWNSSGTRFRHFNEQNINVVFADGHVESMRLNEESRFWTGEPDGGELQQRHVMIYDD
jgi:prepilin-type N-terminal cleavage/methylation domain-containing protein/prepilin-type processing-associated H-X9-DG protein